MSSSWDAHFLCVMDGGNGRLLFTFDRSVLDIFRAAICGMKDG